MYAWMKTYQILSFILLYIMVHLKYFSSRLHFKMHLSVNIFRRKNNQKNLME